MAYNFFQALSTGSILLILWSMLKTPIDLTGSKIRPLSDTLDRYSGIF